MAALVFEACGSVHVAKSTQRLHIDYHYMGPQKTILIMFLWSLIP